LRRAEHNDAQSLGLSLLKILVPGEAEPDGLPLYVFLQRRKNHFTPELAATHVPPPIPVVIEGVSSNVAESTCSG